LKKERLLTIIRKRLYFIKRDMNRIKNIGVAMMFLLIGVSCSAGLEIPLSPTIFNDNQQRYVYPKGVDNAVREGISFPTKNPDQPNDKIGWIQWGDQYIENHDTAKERTLAIVINLVSYALLLASLVALIYLIYHGVLVITAVGDDARYKQGLKWIKYAAIALIGLWLSWVIINTIFWLIFEILLKV
jgi:hypothetical protein